MEFKEFFKTDLDEEPIPTVEGVSIAIDTGTSQPVYGRTYRKSPEEKKIIKEHVEKMLKQKIIQPSESEWNSPILLTKKKNSSWRFCIDFRRINDLTKKDNYPLPRIDDTLDSLYGAQIFCSLDAASGYWHIPIVQKDTKKTTFQTDEGLFEFIKMPFGLKNAPAKYQRFMNNLLGNLRFRWKEAMVYIDDIIIWAKDFVQLLVRLKNVLMKIKQAGVKLNAKNM
mmetsp:Transcript_17599/g.22837  ORF Transcript_17599/g.22837 Transcript_17599/m.22837 type:complete len:225 (+) Transcript_17599:323-997(+)